MKNIFWVCTWVCCILLLTTPIMVSAETSTPSKIFENLKENEKGAILMVHFGTTHNDTRALTIDAINQKAKDTFPNIDVREAFTSRIILKRLHERGIEKLNTLQALEKLSKEGYTHIIVQPSTVINGVEMVSIGEDVRTMKSHFKEIRVGRPLLFNEDSYNDVVEILTKDNSPQMAYILVGHGNQDVSTAQYAMLDYMLKDQGYQNFIVGCIEGFPYYEQALKQLKKTELKNIKLIPLMIVAGEHAKNDIAGDWKEKFENEGYHVKVFMHGLGENPDIQNLYSSKLKFIANNRIMSIMEKKKIYAVTGSKIIDEKK